MYRVMCLRNYSFKNDRDLIQTVCSNSNRILIEIENIYDNASELLYCHKHENSKTILIQLILILIA